MKINPVEKFLWEAPIMGGNHRTVFHLRIVELSKEEKRKYIDEFGVNPSHIISFRDCDGHRTYLGWIVRESDSFIEFKTINGQLHRIEKIFK